jgi:aerobic C4-dicarboxylate transport protein
VQIAYVAKKRYQQLYFQVLAAILIGILLGYFYPETGVAMKPLGDGFIKLIKMIIAPIIFCAVGTGIAGMQELDKVGRVGIKALLYFEVVSTLALVIGLVVVHVIQPGAGMNVDARTLETNGLSAYTAVAKTQNTIDFLLNIIPTSVIDAFAKGELLQVLLISLLFGFSLAAMRETGTEVVRFINKISQVLFGIVETIMKLAPIGAFGAMAFTIGKYGVASLVPLASLMGSFYLTCLLFIFIVLGSIAKFTGFSIIKFIKFPCWFETSPFREIS